MSTTTPFAPLWIDGQVVKASDGKTFEVRNPFTNDVATISASASAEDCRKAVESAQKAFKSWEDYPIVEKQKIFNRAADIFEEKETIERIIRECEEENATVKPWGVINAKGSATTLRAASAEGSKLRGEAFPSVTPGGFAMTYRRAHGVVLSIAPWNAAATLSVRAIAVPLICGNTVVLKSSEMTPRSQALVVEIMHKAGLPPGVLNYVSVSREDSPARTAELIGHPSVRKVNFTGSDRVGRIIATEASKYLKPCVFELGGKAPAVVLDDANVSIAAKAIVQGALLHSGQICMSTERVIMTTGVAPALTKEIIALAEKVKSGDSSTGARLGALFNEASAQNVVGMLTEARDAGAQVLLGSLTSEGAVIQPHVLSGLRPGMRAWDRESFGPVMALVTAKDVDEAVELANASDYSLTASLWTQDVHRALSVAQRIRSGCVSINGMTVSSEPNHGHAGLGGATGYGRFDIDNFTDKRMVIVHPPNQSFPLVENL